MKATLALIAGLTLAMTPPVDQRVARRVVTPQPEKKATLPAQPSPESGRVEERPAARHFRDASPGHIPGIARPQARVVVSAPLDGVLMKVLVQEGQRVKAGEILAVMDNRVAEAAVAAARATAARTADLERANQELLLAEKILARHKTLAEGQAATRHQLDEAAARYEVAKAEVARMRESQDQARCNLELEMARLEAHNIRAPFSGQVVQIHEFAGATLTDKDQLLTLASLSSLEVELHLPVALYGILKPGERYPLLADQPVGSRLEATLKYAAPMIDSASMTFRCVFVIDNGSLRYPAGFAVKLDSAALEGSHKTAKTDPRR